ncbi:MAG: AAA family ATPase [Sphingomonas sp.]|uniref:chromosome segregation SMC family protein n=1 Tax=Sphingomonas sp. TaxID=28214 RepID=UPI0025ECD412|nr:AAA family ATPase [Sphingomonas sp.]MBX9881746.1 AAA family ATPase [Sphingomonas sp.]
MQIKRLRLSGFKSFVDPADLRIEPGLTGIVGPNGCGKSNLLEALRWTMGESSAKSLRGAGMEDVIFAGTTRRPARDFAEVAMLIEGAEGETEVVRRIERGAGSAYRINGRDVRAKDVALLFADAATGAHSPALVSQGRIGAVINAKPAERRAMLEEAAGIAGLHVRRRDAEQRLRATEANLTRLGEIMAEQEARIGALKRQARQAERYRALSDQIRVAEARLIFTRWQDAAAAADAARAEAEGAEARVAEAAEAQRAAAAHQTAATGALAEARATALAARDRASELGHQLSGLRQESESVARRLAEAQEAQGRLAADRAREGELAEDAAAALARLTAEAKEIDARLAEAVKRVPEADAALVDAERGARDAEVALAQAMAAQAAEAAEARVAAAALQAARARAQRAEADAARLATEARALADAGPIDAERARAAAERAQALAHAEQARAALSEAEGAERTARASRDHAQAERSRAHAELTALDSESAALAKATRPSGKARVLDELRPAAGYERALAAALGDDLEAGLDREAERHWAGAAPLPSDPPPPAGAVPLADRVAAPAALARRLAQVFVVEADGGQPLAVGQRLVTLGGQLRRWDGFVARSGGAAAAERLERLGRLRALEAARPAAVRAVEGAEAELARIDAAVTEARQRGIEARRLIDAAEARARDAARAEDRASAALERLEAQRRDLAARQARVASEAGEAAADLARAEAAHATLPDGRAAQAQVGALQQAAEAARARVAEARSARLALDRALENDRGLRGRADAEAKSWRQRAGDAARRIADMAKRAEALGEEIAVLAAKPAGIEARLVALAAEHEAARAAADVAMAEERAAEGRLRETERLAAAAAETLATARETRAAAAARAENQALRRVEMARLAGERFECPPPLLPERAGFRADEVRGATEESARHDRLIAERERLGAVNLVAESELAEIEAALGTSEGERDELVQAVNRLRGSIGTLNREGRQRLLAAFEAVNGHFQRLFTTLFNGGQAHLALVDSDDPLEAGLEIMAQPPGKKLQSLTLLSGGEQALTAVALIFGLFLTNPAPICVLDEVDAPLDDANIERFCDLLEVMTRETATRYLIVTHNAVTMSRMHRLFGVTMVEQGVSRLVSVDLSGAEALLAA